MVGYIWTSHEWFGKYTNHNIYYLGLWIAIHIYCTSHFLPPKVELVVWTLEH